MGLIETRGWVGAVEAADAMCKAARVRLVRCETVHDALVTVQVRGALAEVEAAVEAGWNAASRVGETCGRHVIPTPDPMLEGLVAGPSTAVETPQSTW